INEGPLWPGSNSAITFAPANLTITAKGITVTANPQTKAFGAADPELSYTSSESVAFTGALARATGENVGNYAINEGTLSAGSNYIISFHGANLAITAKGITGTANSQTKNFGAADPGLSYTSNDA